MDMTQCIEACSRCHGVCVATMQHCLKLGGKHAAAEHIRDMQDCAQICATAADFMLRGSAAHAYVCAACAEACDRCEESCREVNDSPEMQRCIDACRACGTLCHRMAGMVAA